ncbi:MAG: hypothetical protein LBD53_06660 [Tannerella sp.]|nr:hypothetical protein [Tannerella sp.]
MKRNDDTTSLRGTKQSGVPFPSGLLPVFRIASYLPMTDVSSKPLAGFKTTARVWGTRLAMTDVSSKPLAGFFNRCKGLRNPSRNDGRKLQTTCRV